MNLKTRRKFIFKKLKEIRLSKESLDLALYSLADIFLSQITKNIVKNE